MFFCVRPSAFAVLIISVLDPVAPLHSGASMAKGGETSRPRLAVGLGKPPPLHEAGPARGRAGACRHGPAESSLRSRRRREKRKKRKSPTATARRAGRRRSIWVLVTVAASGEEDVESRM
jgi:hypothetical protein